MASGGRNASDRVSSIEFGRIGSGREGDDVFTGDVLIGEVDVFVGDEWPFMCAIDSLPISTLLPRSWRGTAWGGVEGGVDAGACGSGRRECRAEL